jgi:hypothetical protein
MQARPAKQEKENSYATCLRKGNVEALTLNTTTTRKEKTVGCG